MRVTPASTSARSSSSAVASWPARQSSAATVRSSSPASPVSMAGVRTGSPAVTVRPSSRSIRRETNRPGSSVSSSAAAARCSSRKRWMRSRASGGTCGDSSAAASPSTRSSLRRRASWMTRASSVWRMTMGGPASARTTAPASPGSTSRRIQASRSRRPARWGSPRWRSRAGAAAADAGDAAALRGGDTEPAYWRDGDATGLRSMVWT